MAKRNKTQHDLLFEIGTEEMPANYLSYANSNQQELLRRAFLKSIEIIDDSNRLSIQEFNIYLTPRRIVFHLPNFAYDNSTIKQTIFGPPAERAYDSDGKPSKMLQGFIKSKEIALSEVKILENKGRQSIAYEHSLKALHLVKYFERAFNEFFDQVSFPKWMWWDDSSARFPRPIRSLLMILDGKISTIKIKGIKSGNQTFVLKNASRKSYKVASEKQFFNILNKAGVVVDQNARREIIEKKVNAIIKRKKGIISNQDELLEEVAYLSEIPVCVGGPYNSQYTNLPPEVLSTSLSKSQRLFSVMTDGGQYLPYFIAVLDGGLNNNKTVLSTIAAVLSAKLQDSTFFYSEDIKVYKSEEETKNLQAELGDLLYIKGMGSMLSKMDRLTKIVSEHINEWGVSDQDILDIKSAIPYAKLDLLSQMVGEFPELQGVIGAAYTLESRGNEFKGASMIIRDQYLPLGPSGELPKTRAAGVFSILDKSDLIVSCFVLGKKPGSSQDPYALKRAMAGVFRIAIHHKININWKSLVDALLSNIKESGVQSDFVKNDIANDLLKFYRERLEYFFEHQGYDQDLVRAVLSVQPYDVNKAHHKLNGISKILDDKDFERAKQIIHRTSNILKSCKDFVVSPIDESTLEQEVERKLYAAYKQNKEGVLQKVNTENIKLATSLYATAFFDILHEFFEQVLVNVDDINVRQNRLSLLALIRALYVEGVADLSQIKTR